MKILTPLFVGSILTASLATATFADIKGGERLASAGARPIFPETKAATKMTCPTEVRTVQDLSARGATKPVSVYTSHNCTSCETKEVAQGAGKLARRSLEHTCAMAAHCCK